MVEIHRVMTRLPAASEVSAEDVSRILDTNAKDVPELKPNAWLVNEFSRLDVIIEQDDHVERELEAEALELLRVPGDEEAEFTRFVGLSLLHLYLAWITRDAKKDWALSRRYAALGAVFGRAAPEPLLVGGAHYQAGSTESAAGGFANAGGHHRR